MDTEMSRIKETATTIASRMSAMLPAEMMSHKLYDALAQAQNDNETKKLKFTIRADVDVSADEIIEFETWSEISQTKKDVSEKIGETFDLRQSVMNLGE